MRFWMQIVLAIVIGVLTACFLTIAAVMHIHGVF
jgi:hypothetical protein